MQSLVVSQVLHHQYSILLNHYSLNCKSIFSCHSSIEFSISKKEIRKKKSGNGKFFIYAFTGTGLAGMRQRDLIQWYVSQQNEKNNYSSMEEAATEVSKIKAIIEVETNL